MKQGNHVGGADSSNLQVGGQSNSNHACTRQPNTYVSVNMFITTQQNVGASYSYWSVMRIHEQHRDVS